MPVFSRTVVTAAEILRNIPPDEDDWYTINGKLKRGYGGETGRCTARQGLPDHCPRAAERGELCAGHEARKRHPPASCEWDSPIRKIRGRPKGVSNRVHPDRADAA